MHYRYIMRFIIHCIQRYYLSTSWPWIVGMTRAYEDLNLARTDSTKITLFSDGFRTTLM